MKHMMIGVINFALLVAFSCGSSANAEIAVEDFRGRLVSLPKPARTIVALAPHACENLFAVGAGAFIIGTVERCDYPDQANHIERVGAISSFNLENIVRLKPDLVVLWGTGRAENALAKLEKLGLAVYVSDPRSLPDIPRSIRDMGRLTGKGQRAELVAKEFEQRYQALTNSHKHADRLSVFYQVWDKPIYTVNNSHLISDVIRLCGGENAFGDAVAIAPKISIESVMARDPDVIIASGMGEARPDWLEGWNSWPSLSAVKNKDLYFIPPDIIQRHTLRILDGAEIMCNHLDKARKKA